MKLNKSRKSSAKAEFIRVVRGLCLVLYPVAHGTLSGCGFAAHQGYGFAWGGGHWGGRRPLNPAAQGPQRSVPLTQGRSRPSKENGRMLEEAILDEGIAFLERLRERE